MAALAGVGDVTIRELSAADDLDALLDLSCRAFGPVGPADRERWQADSEAAIGGRQFLAAFDGSRLVAAARYDDMAQWWHGRCMPMAGVASVMVAPEDRGRGAGGALMTTLLGLIAERGYPVSVLYPATMAIYRSLGWEIAGVQHTVAIPARSLRSLVPPDPGLGSPEPAGVGPAGVGPAGVGPGSVAAGSVAAGSVGPGGVAAELRRCGPEDAGQVLAAIGAVHQALRDSGPNTRDEATVRRWLGDESRFAYLAPDGFLAYRWLNGSDEILVERAVAGSAATTRALWAIVASHSSMASTVRGYLGPADPVGWLTREPDVALARRRTWMLRLVDAAGAVAGRGFPPAAEVRAELRLTDGACPRNDGTWTLEVSGGKGVLAREPRPGPATRAAPLAAGARGLAALFAGTPVATLRRAGLVSGGDPGNDAALDGAFAATAFLLDYF
jgi:GNAT superfamily N-acetyltransferase